MSVDMHERRAERGTHRGAANVWANAQPEVAPASEPAGSWMFRLVLGLWLCIAVGAVVLAGTRGSEVDTEDGGVAQALGEESAQGAGDEDLPLPILIEGIDLYNVSGPCFVGDRLICDVDRPISTNFDGFDPELGTRTPTIVIFGEEQSPFTGPVVGIETFDGGFRTWTLNVDQDGANELVEQVTRLGDTWLLPESAGLVEVARFEDSTDPLNTWQFDFDDDAATLQPLRAADGKTASEWEWIVPLVRIRDFGPTVDFAALSLQPVDVLGRDALQLHVPYLADNGEAEGTRVASTIWADGGYAYRLIGPPNGDGRIVDQLVLVDRDEWESAVTDAYFDESAESLAILLVLAFTIVSGATILWFLFKRRWLSILIVLVALFAVYALLSFPSVGFGLLVGFGGLALAAFVGRKPKADQSVVLEPAEVADSL